jgi:BlaI family transcriptional regulator, penicillinase repressor
MKSTPHLTPGEYELMDILWPLGEASVKDVWSRVNPARGLAYTTVMTVLEKMHRKGILARRKKGKAYLYSASLNREEARKGVIERMCEAYFAGSGAELVGFIDKHFAPSAIDKPEPAPDPGESKANDPPA